MLHSLGLGTGTDKVHHVFRGKSYCDIYDRYLNSIRHRVKTFVEIGVKEGQSLRMFESYFPNATIYGIDIDPACKQYETDRIKIFIGDQNDDAFLDHLKTTLGPIDVLLDDGSHITSHQLKTFSVLYPSIARGGFYIVEDLRNSYEDVLNPHDVRTLWPGMSYNNPTDPLKNYRKDFVDFVESQIRELDFHTHPTLFAVHHYPMILIFETAA